MNREERLLREFIERQDGGQLVRLAMESPGLVESGVHELFFALKQVDAVTVSDSEETACLEVSPTRIGIRLGAGFLRERIRSLESLSYLLLHEAAHLLLLHHLEQNPYRIRSDNEVVETRMRQVANFVMDIFVARFLYTYLLRPVELQRELFCRGLANALLGPPDLLAGTGWRQRRDLTEAVHLALWRRARAEGASVPPAVLRQMAAGYANIWQGRLTLLKALHYFGPLVNFLPLPTVWVVRITTDLLPSDCPLPLPPALRELFRQAAEQMGGWDHRLREALAKGNTHPGLSRAIARKILRHMPRTSLARLAGELREFQTPVLLHTGRTQSWMLSQGHVPPFFPLPGGFAPERRQVRVYADVSGSTREYWPAFLNALRLVLSGCQLEPFQFSNVVAPLRPGGAKVETTLGTDFDCVVRHALRNRPPDAHAIILTDGQAGLSPAASREARRHCLRFNIFLLDATTSNALRSTFDGLLSTPGLIIFTEEIRRAEACPGSAGFDSSPLHPLDESLRGGASTIWPAFSGVPGDAPF